MELFSKKYLNLIKEITKAEFKIREQSKVLGFLWTLLYPLTMFFITYFIFFRWSGKYIDKFTPYLLVGIVQWGYFVNATTVGMAMVVSRRVYVRNFSFPYEILIASSILSNLIIHLFETAILLIVLFWINNGLSPIAFLFPIFIIIETFLILGIAFILAALNVFLRDMEYIWTILLRISIFITPVFYSINMLSEKQKILIMFNPLTYILDITRSVLVYKTMPKTINIILAFSISLILLLVGYKIFKKFSIKFSEFV